MYPSETHPARKGSLRRPPQASTTSSEYSRVGKRPAVPEEGIWFNKHLHQRETTARLDAQEPATLYYLGRIVEINDVVSVYVEHKESGTKKHWTVIGSRDFDVMDEVYDIEIDTLDKFPLADLKFRVTVATDGGPSAAEGAMKIYDRK